MKVLVTGGTGFVGKHLQEELQRRSISFFAFGKRQFDLTRQENAEAVFKKNSDADFKMHSPGHSSEASTTASSRSPGTAAMPADPPGSFFTSPPSFT